jgi:hypothetical protein
MDSVEVATDAHLLKTKQWDEYVPNVHKENYSYAFIM